MDRSMCAHLPPPEAPLYFAARRGAPRAAGRVGVESLDRESWQLQGSAALERLQKARALRESVSRVNL